jgi:LmbE family N-acetylglucosaminyl deacetylase
MRILVVAPHADDEVLGVGATMARYADEGYEVVAAIMTGHGEEGAHPLFPQEAWDVVRAEAAQAHAILGVKETLFEEIPAVMVSDQPLWQLNKLTAGIINRVRPDVLYIPFPYDLHRDHRELAHSFSVAWRPSSEPGRRIQEILAYETVSETHWGFPYLEQGFLPNRWADVGKYLPQKLQALECFRSQMQPFPHARSLQAVEALARWRGSQMGMAAAEAFVIVRRLW